MKERYALCRLSVRAESSKCIQPNAFENPAPLSWVLDWLSGQKRRGKVLDQPSVTIAAIFDFQRAARDFPVTEALWRRRVV
jgi:hypothetical protein